MKSALSWPCNPLDTTTAVANVAEALTGLGREVRANGGSSTGHGAIAALETPAAGGGLGR